MWYDTIMDAEMNTNKEITLFSLAGASVPGPAWCILFLLIIIQATSLFSVLFPGGGMPVILASLLVQNLLFLLLPFWCVKKAGGGIKHLGMRRVPVGSTLFLGLRSGVLFYFLNIAVSLLQMLAFPGYQPEQQSVVQVLEACSSVWEVASLVFFILLVAPVAEEVFFRGFLYPVLYRKWGYIAAVLLSAIIFSASHLHLWAFLPLFAGGIGFAMLYHKKQNLWANICAHAVWNAISLGLFFLVK